MFAATTAFGALRSILWPFTGAASSPGGAVMPTSAAAAAAAMACASDPVEDDVDDESARLERIYMCSSPRERADAFTWAMATPPSPTSPRGTATEGAYQASLLEALVMNFDDTDRAMARKPGAGYVRTHRGLGDDRQYALKPSEHEEFALGARIVGVSTGRVHKSSTVECRLDVRFERARGARIDVCCESLPVADFIAGKIGTKRYGEFVDDAQTPPLRAEMCERVFKPIQAALLRDQDSWETNGSIDLFFNSQTNFVPAGHVNLTGSLREFVAQHLDPLDGARFAVVSFDASTARHRVRWDSDELAARAPWRVIRFDTAELVDLTSSEMRTMCLWRAGARTDFMTCAMKRIARYERANASKRRRHNKRNVQSILQRKVRDPFAQMNGALGLAVARHVVEIGAGSALSSCEIAAASAKTVDGRDVVCYALDPHIKSLVHDPARNNPRVVLVEQCIEDVDVSRIPPIGVVRFVLAAPECAAVSVAAEPHYAHLRDQFGDAFGDLIRACAIRLTSAMTRSCVDLIKYLNAPAVIENPSGNVKVGLFNERHPFYGWRIRIVDTSYCKYNAREDGSFRKHTTLVTNVPQLSLQAPCSHAHPCPDLTDNGRHRRRCSHTGATRAESKLHPPALIRSIVEQVDVFIDRLSSAHLTRDEDDDAERAGELIDAATLPRDDELVDAIRGGKAARRSIHGICDFGDVSVLGRSDTNGRLEKWFAEIIDSKPTRHGRVRVRYLVETTPASNVYMYEHGTGESHMVHMDSILDVYERGHLCRA